MKDHTKICFLLLAILFLFYLSKNHLDTFDCENGCGPGTGLSCNDCFTVGGSQKEFDEDIDKTIHILKEYTDSDDDGNIHYEEIVDLYKQMGEEMSDKQTQMTLLFMKHLNCKPYISTKKAHKILKHFKEKKPVFFGGNEEDDTFNTKLKTFLDKQMSK